jgi:hypothetical protein
MVNVYRTQLAPATLKIRYQRSLLGQTPGYDSNIVRKRLRIDFHNKCYLCESKQSDTESFIGGNERIEHFLPHLKGTHLDRKYGWANLFLSCDYCNGAKGQEAELINCTEKTYTITEALIFNYVTGSLKPNITVSNSFLADNFAIKTQRLLNKIYNEPNSNLQIEIAGKLRVHAKQSFNNFILKLEDLNDNPKNKTKEKALEEELSEESEYLAFKISYLKSSPNLMTKFGHLIPKNI